MKQLLILSGKGGTGKTTVAGAFIKLHQARSFADCDVDAPNLHLISECIGTPQRRDYFGLQKAQIDPVLCVNCGRCRDNCRFDAIFQNEKFVVDVNACEGCGVCAYVCPAAAITLTDAVAGELFLYLDKAVFSTAKLKMGSGTSGKLVSEVKKQLTAVNNGADLAIIDGSPGIGCPVIASLSGADMVLVVAEPSVSGISDMERIIKTARYFGTETAVCVNKYDTNLAKTEKIKEYCKENDIAYVGSIPYDRQAVAAINDGKSIVDTACPAGTAVRAVYNKTIEIMQNKGLLAK
jgi:MinD superfamily P-loop ATPase